MVGFAFHIEDPRGVGARKRERLGVIDVNESLESMNHLLYVHPSAGAVALVLLSVVETDSASAEEGTYSATASGENTHLSWLLGTFQLSGCIYLRGEDVMEKGKKNRSIFHHSFQVGFGRESSRTAREKQESSC